MAVIRVSGKDSKLAVYKLLNRTTLLKPRYAYLTSIYNPVTKELLDKGLVLWFPGICLFNLSKSNLVIIYFEVQTVLQGKMFANFKYTAVRLLYRVFYSP